MRALQTALRLPTELLQLIRYASTSSARVDNPGRAVSSASKFVHLHHGDDPTGEAIRRTIMSEAHKGNAITCLELCAELKKGSKGRLRRNDLHNLMHAFALSGSRDTVIDLMELMETQNHTHTTATYNAVLLACVVGNYDIAPILVAMEQSGCERDSTTYEHLILKALKDLNLEQALYWLLEAGDRDFAVALETRHGIATLACASSEPRIAFELCEEAERLHPEATDSTDNAYDQMYATLLDACAINHFLPGVKWAYKRLADRKISFLEGTLVAVLESAGRAAEIDLAIDCIDRLKALEIILQEHHVAPLIEAFSRAGEPLEAMRVLNMLHESGSAPTIHTGSSIVAALLSQYGQKRYTLTDQRDGSGRGYDILKAIAKEGPVQPAVLNTVIEANVRAGSVKRALTIHRDFPNLTKVQANTHTYNILLEGCVRLRSIDLANRLLAELKYLGLPPTQQTYELMAEVCLAAVEKDDSLIEAALGYFAAMQKYDALPSRRICGLLYAELRDRKDPRAKDIAEVVERQYGNKAVRKIRTIRAARLPKAVTEEGAEAEDSEVGSIPENEPEEETEADVLADLDQQTAASAEARRNESNAPS